MKEMVVFVDSTRKAPRSLVWRSVAALIAILVVIVFGIFVYRPDWLMVPPGWKPPANVQYIK